MTHGPKFDILVRRYEEACKDHVLVVPTPPPPGNVPLTYLLSRKGSSTYHAWIIFAADRIIIFGDAVVGGERGNGVISDFGYGLAWFASSLDVDYLCEKFLVEEWDPDRAQEWIDERLSELDPTLVEERRCLEQIRDGQDFSESAFEPWHDYVVDCDDWPSRDYNTGHAAMLSVIQRLFKRLWEEQLAAADKKKEVP